MITISLCMIVKDEEVNLPRCLETVKNLVDEIIIVDTGSQDHTVERAKQYTNLIYYFAWKDDFSAARNYAFDQATKDYLMWMDADDVLLIEDQKKFQQLKETLPLEADMVMMPYHTAFDEKGNPTFAFYRERLLKRTCGYRFLGAVHEAIEMRGNIIYSSVAVTHKKTGTHDTNRNLRIYEGLIKKGALLAPRDQFYYARELMEHNKDEKAAEVFEKFLSDKGGWSVNKVEACHDLATIYERQKKTERVLDVLIKCFCFAPPGAKTCCEIGNYYIIRKDYYNAIFWYQQALKCPRDDKTGGFTMPDYYDYIPYIQLSCCFYYLDDYQSAVFYHERAGQVKPYGKAYLSNKKYFEKERI